LCETKIRKEDEVNKEATCGSCRRWSWSRV